MKLPTRPFLAGLSCAGLLLLLPGGDTVESLEGDAKAGAAKGDQNAAAIHYQALLAQERGHVEASS